MCMSVTTFHDADGPGASEAFERWRREHPRGFFLNFGSPSDMMVHRTECPRFVFRVPRSLTSYEKACADEVEELETWAADHSHLRPGFCRICSPRA
jgi:hypothetical protein